MPSWSDSVGSRAPRSSPSPRRRLYRHSLGQTRCNRSIPTFVLRFAAVEVLTFVHSVLNESWLRPTAECLELLPDILSNRTFIVVTDLVIDSRDDPVVGCPTPLIPLTNHDFTVVELFHGFATSRLCANREMHNSPKMQLHRHRTRQPRCKAQLVSSTWKRVESRSMRICRQLASSYSMMF